MSKKIFMVIITGVFVLGISKLSFAMMCGGHSQHKHTTQAHTEEHTSVEQEMVTESTSEEPINVGNKICPVSGDKIEEEARATYEYEGKIYNFCCPMCIEEFKKDPQKYIEKVEEELKAQEKEETVTEPEELGHMHEGHHH